MFRISCIAYLDDGCLLDVGRRLPLQRVWSDYALDKSSLGQNKPILPNSWQFHSNVAAGAWLFVGLRTQTSWSHATALSHHYIRLDPNILLNTPKCTWTLWVSGRYWKVACCVLPETDGAFRYLQGPKPGLQAQGAHHQMNCETSTGHLKFAWNRFSNKKQCGLCNGQQGSPDNQLKGCPVN